MKRLIFLGLPVLALVATGCETDSSPAGLAEPTAPALSAAPVLQETAPIFDEFNTGAGVGGSATITRSKDGIWVDGTATGLTIGHAYSIWFAHFDNPKGCGKDGCGLPDLGSRQAQVTVGNAGGFVAGAATWDFSAHWDRHDLGGRQVLIGDGKGVDNPFGSETHIILRSHGTAENDAADLAAQLGEVDSFCNLPVVGCEDQGVAIFLPSGPPGRR